MLKCPNVQLPDLSPVESKEYKPGPIGKERSLKNKKVKEAQQGDSEGQEKSSPTAVRSPDPVASKEVNAAAELGAEIGTMISVSSPEFRTTQKVRNKMEGKGKFVTPNSWNLIITEYIFKEIEPERGWKID